MKKNTSTFIFLLLIVSMSASLMIAGFDMIRGQFTMPFQKNFETGQDTLSALIPVLITVVIVFFIMYGMYKFASGGGV